MLLTILQLMPHEFPIQLSLIQIVALEKNLLYENIMCSPYFIKNINNVNQIKPCFCKIIKIKLFPLNNTHVWPFLIRIEFEILTVKI